MIFPKDEFLCDWQRDREAARERWLAGRRYYRMTKDPAAQVRQILERSAKKAAKVLCDTLADEQAGSKERYAAALEILNRLYGRSMSGEEPHAEQVEVILTGKAADWAK